jgi:hypothetical protein
VFSSQRYGSVTFVPKYSSVTTRTGVFGSLTCESASPGMKNPTRRQQRVRRRMLVPPLNTHIDFPGKRDFRQQKRASRMPLSRSQLSNPPLCLQDSGFEFANFGIEGGGFEGPDERITRVGGIDDGVDPEAGGGIARIGLVFVGGTDGFV